MTAAFDPREEPAQPESRPGSEQRQYRLSDHERTLAINVLSEAYTEGRLDAEEFRERMSEASEAKYASDLDPLFVDLPGRTPVFQARPAHEQRPHAARPTRPHGHPHARPVRYSRPGPFGPMPARPPRPLVFLPVMMLILATTHFWFLLPLLFISLGMLNECSRGPSRRISGRADPRSVHGGPDGAKS